MIPTLFAKIHHVVFVAMRHVRMFTYNQLLTIGMIVSCNGNHLLTVQLYMWKQGVDCSH